MTEQFDSLAKAAADGLSRRQVVKIAVALAVAAVLPKGLLRPGPASAGVVGISGFCPKPASGSCPNGTKALTPACRERVSNGAAGTYNGCGPASGIDLKQLVNSHLPQTHLEPPDNPLWLAKFADACNEHDCCYGRCGADKAQCDYDFDIALKTACATANLPMQAYAGILGSTLGLFCYYVAQTYYAAVAIGGRAAFEQSQAKVCHCCCEAGEQCCNAPSGFCDCDPACLPQYPVCCHDSSGKPYCPQVLNDPTNCGACGHKCGPCQDCFNGVCRDTCTELRFECCFTTQLGFTGYYCINTYNDPCNCGGCGHLCPNGTCFNGACQPGAGANACG